ncbi:hypothetical protein Egran_06026 [Elaphomyces granulatus]|uniref:Endosomal peripheral membrane protein n=1 Tax=Elaphomyces granulatus TaxID=519963 RepID=A0A232LPY4_9EURO|nr:hypothetical protein Egran_06026 [Elaphomyces granulatus]
MASQFLQTELSTLIQESKRKNSDLRNAAEQSLSDLKALPSTSEAQLTADLIRKPNFVNAFILACHARHAKLSGIGVVCIQRLVASQSLPPERLKDTLNGLRETTSLGQDVQLKILQTLPALLQNYSEDLSGELLGKTLEICATLQNSKTTAVANTAAATLQQLVIAAFEKVSREDGKPQDSAAVVTLNIDGRQIDVGPSACDALRILDDFCRLIEGEKLDFLQIKSLSPSFILELIESILTNSGQLPRSHPEQMQVLKKQLMPLLLRHLSERHSFPQTVRVARILLILVKNYMPLLIGECEMAMSLLTHLLEPDVSPSWKRVLCMEVFRGLHAEPGTMRLIYTLFDGVESRKYVLKDHMTSLVRLASEKPSIIGVSHQSTVPSGAAHSRTNTEDQITLEVGGVAGVIGTAVTSADTSILGISSQWSIVRTSYLELLDKTDAPAPPETYIYSLVLNCIGSFSENLAKFILPLTVPDTKNKRKIRVGVDHLSSGNSRDLQSVDSWRGQGFNSKRSTVPLNPLDLEDHPQLAGIRACAGILETCWPAILATCSTFLYAALDRDFYHNLVRSFQKLTHVAGLLRLSTPRDAFLTTLGKASMPIDGPSVGTLRTVAPPIVDSQYNISPDHPPTEKESSAIASQLATETPNSSFESVHASLSTRNLLCLRALLNLGIALGSTLDQPTWAIILETLQNADLVIGISASVISKQNSNASSNGGGIVTSGSEVPKTNLGAEIAAVGAAASKMFESTADYPDHSFKAILEALLNLSRTTDRDASMTVSSTAMPSHPSQAPRRVGRLHQNIRSISLTMRKSRIEDDELKFVLERTSDLANSNLDRLSESGTDETVSWNFLTTSLISIMIGRDVSPDLRLKASKVFNDIIAKTMKRGHLDEVTGNQLQLRNLQALKLQITSLHGLQSGNIGSQNVRIDIHEQALDTLKSLLEQHGESLVAGWDLVFDLISSAFEDPRPFGIRGKHEEPIIKARPKLREWTARSPRLIRTAYKSLQLIASDFLPLLPPEYLLDLVHSFSGFASQNQDFNISLTTTTFFWNVSDFLHNQIEQFTIEGQIDAFASEETLSELAENTNVLISRSALWLLLLLRIVDLTTDDRSEIRISAIRTLLRIFDAYGQQLSPRAWHLCLNRVIFVMVESIQDKLLNVCRTSPSLSSDDTKQWVEAAVIMTKGCSDLIANFFDSIVHDERFDESWSRLLRYLEVLAQVKLYELSEAIFSSISNILSRAESADTMSKSSIQSVWSLWIIGHPTLREEALDMESPNQDALLAYFHSFQQIYRLFKCSLTKEHINQILFHMRAAIWNSVSSPYSTDVDHQSTLQRLVSDCIKTLCSDMEASQSAIILCLADFADSALARWTADRSKSRPTFVAFSKQSIDLLSSYVTDFGMKGDIFRDGSLTTALEHLVNPIFRKYEWQGRDPEPTIWRKATSASLELIRVVIPVAESQCSKTNQEEISRFWKCIVDITRGLVSAKGYAESGISTAKIQSDEVFDIAAFHRLVSLVIPSLGSAAIPDRVRQDFACAIFQSSLIHPPQRFDPTASAEDEPLQDLYKVRRGRTYEPPPTPRTKMAYVLVDTMFELAASTSTSTFLLGHGGGEESSPAEARLRISIARSISPYLILRSSMPLKAYIADQPLRGLMPQPTSSRRELIHLLSRMVELRSEPAAIPEAPAFAAIRSPSLSASGGGKARLLYKKHLGWMYPLVVKAVEVAGKEREDGKILEVLARVLHEVGDGHSIKDEE